MTRPAARFSASGLLLVLLVGSNAAQAFSFCFSFGGGGSNRGRADFHDYPPPGRGPAIYPGYPYPYSPLSPAYPYGYYPPSPDSASAAEADSAEPASAPRPTLGWPK